MSLQLPPQLKESTTLATSLQLPPYLRKSTLVIYLQQSQDFLIHQAPRLLVFVETPQGQQLLLSILVPLLQVKALLS